MDAETVSHVETFLGILETHNLGIAVEATIPVDADGRASRFGGADRGGAWRVAERRQPTCFFTAAPPSKELGRLSGAHMLLSAGRAPKCSVSPFSIMMSWSAAQSARG